MTARARARWRALAAAAGAAAVLAAGCGGGDDDDDLTAEEALRDCLTEQNLTVESSDLGASAGLGNASADFRVISSKGEIADVIVEGSDGKAEKTSADVKAAKQSFGAGNSVVVKQGNTVVVFEDEPPADFRDQVVGCAD